jgi:D-alanine-D-alanine ligase
MSQIINVLILGGGDSSEHEVSVKTAKQVMKHLPANKYKAELLIVPKGKMHELAEKITYMRQFDIIFLALHGTGGEDGSIQGFFDTAKITYTGSGVLASSLAMDKYRSSLIFQQHNIQVPRSMLYELHTWKKHKRDINTLHMPLIVKPNRSGSSVGISIVKTSQEIDQAFEQAFAEDDEVLVQEMIEGREFTCAILGNQRGQLRVLPLVEIIPHQAFFNYDAKYMSKTTEEICPADVNEHIAKKLQDVAARAHQALGCDGLSRTDMMMNAQGDIYILETNTLPGLTEASLAPKAAQADGMDFGEFLEQMIILGLSAERNTHIA